MGATIKERLMQFINIENIEKSRFEKETGLSNGFVDKIGSTIRSKSLDKVRYKYPHLNIHWLLTGEGEMLKDGYPTPSQKGVIRYWTDVDVTGGGIELFEDVLTHNIIDIKIPEFNDCTDAVNIYGDSMTPRYKNGQIIILKEWNESFIEYGNVYLIITKKGHRMIKYLRKSDDPTEVLCFSENPDYDPFSVALEDIYKLYLVKGSIEKVTL